MPDISQLQQMIKKARQDLEAALPAIAVENALNAKALAERNIRQKGFGAKYSGNRVPAWYFMNEWKSARGEAYVKNKEEYDEKNAKIVDGEKVYAEDAGVLWSEMRQAEGLQVAHVDLGFTNKMWAGLMPQSPVFQGEKIICTLAGNTAEVINKLSWNFQRYGNFFGKVIGQKELEAMTQAVADRVKIILVNNGFKR